MVATVSARALNVASLRSLSGFDHYDGTRPQRIGTSHRLPSWAMIVSMVVVGHTLKRGWVFCAGWYNVSRYNATISSHVSL